MLFVLHLVHVQSIVDDCRLKIPCAEYKTYYPTITYLDAGRTKRSVGPQSCRVPVLIGFDNGEVQTVSDDQQRGPAEGRAEPFGTCTMGFLLMLEAKLNTSKNI